jgi:PKD repeat protein
VQTTPNANNLSGGTYNVIVMDANGCSQQQSVCIAAGGNVPLADFTTSTQTAALPNSTFDFTNNSLGATTWAWNFGDGTSSSLQNPPSHTYADTGTYCVTLVVTTGNAVCVDTIVHCVEVTAEFDFYIPNAFTPNGDWDNEFFFGKSRGVKDYTIRLFDRWGNLIWDCHKEGYRADLDQNSAEGLSSVCKWDGTVTNSGADLNGSSKQLVQEDVYVWKVELTDIFNNEHKYIGHVSVVR